jgi:hypothetical protein
MREGTINEGSITQIANSYIVVGSGPTSTRPTANAGTFRYNTTINNFEGCINGVWLPMTADIKPVFGSIAAQTGSTTITNSNTAITSASGTQIMTQSYTPAFATSIVQISLNFLIDVSTSGAYITCGIFRNTTLIGLRIQTIDQFTATLTTTQNIPSFMAIEVMDSPATNAAVTYSARIGVSAGNWFVNKSQSFTYGAAPVFAGNYIIKEFL